ncbi:CamS family sex pheromone protein, partial [Lactobacillus sp. XV13L]|nr:CamS family sex pheromone protein [Lactobacillus sp. XV13L]
IILVLLMVAGCGNLGNSSLSSRSQNGKNAKVTTTPAAKSGQYSTLLQNGRYRVSTISGLTADSDSNNNHNVQSFEAGLLAVSQKEFSPDKYYFQEGQMISSTTARKWLGRKSANNPLGLNPEDNGSKDPDKRNPIYLQQLLEEDFYTQSDKDYHLSAMTIGLAMNEVDYYTKEMYGATFETKISDEQWQAMGQEMANKIVQRLRRNNNLKSIPIVVGLYRQNINDSLVGGTFFSYGVSHKDSLKINDWKPIK